MAYIRHGLEKNMSAKPFIKWAGGKAYLLPRLTRILEDSCLDTTTHHYIEPMVGGGAVFYNLGSRFSKQTISDLNPELINLYSVVKGHVYELISELSNGHYTYTHKSDPHTLEKYKSIRASTPTGQIQRAARTLYLMKTCFNGLMRVNKSGQFNTPPGSYTNPIICDTPTLVEANAALASTTIVGPIGVLDFLSGELPKNTFLFLDPPYHHADSSKFTGYSGEFGDDEQTDLIRILLDIKKPFIYTNRATPMICDLFANTGTTLCKVPLKHSIQPKYTTGMIEEELVAYRF